MGFSLSQEITSATLLAVQNFQKAPQIYEQEEDF